MPAILIIDDDQELCVMMETLFTKAGYAARTASDGQKGIELFKKEGADLIITDIFMPEKEGIELIRELRRDYPEVKIIAISGGGPETLHGIPVLDVFSMAERIGASRVFEKPVDTGKLLAAVQELLQQS